MSLQEEFNAAITAHDTQEALRVLERDPGPPYTLQIDSPIFTDQTTPLFACIGEDHVSLALAKALLARGASTDTLSEKRTFSEHLLHCLNHWLTVATLERFKVLWQEGLALYNLVLRRKPVLPRERVLFRDQFHELRAAFRVMGGMKPPPLQIALSKHISNRDWQAACKLVESKEPTNTLDANFTYVKLQGTLAVTPLANAILKQLPGDVSESASQHDAILRLLDMLVTLHGLRLGDIRPRFHAPIDLLVNWMAHVRVVTDELARRTAQYIEVLRRGGMSARELYRALDRVHRGDGRLGRLVGVLNDRALCEAIALEPVPLAKRVRLK